MDSMFIFKGAKGRYDVFLRGPDIRVGTVWQMKDADGKWTGAFRKNSLGLGACATREDAASYLLRMAIRLQTGSSANNSLR